MAKRGVRLTRANRTGKPPALPQASRAEDLLVDRKRQAAATELPDETWRWKRLTELDVTCLADCFSIENLFLGLTPAFLPWCNFLLPSAPLTEARRCAPLEQRRVEQPPPMG